MVNMRSPQKVFARHLNDPTLFQKSRKWWALCTAGAVTLMVVGFILLVAVSVPLGFIVIFVSGMSVGWCTGLWAIGPPETTEDVIKRHETGDDQ